MGVSPGFSRNADPWGKPFFFGDRPLSPSPQEVDYNRKEDALKRFFTGHCPHHGQVDFLYMEITLSHDAAGEADQTDGFDQCSECWSEQESDHQQWVSSGYPEDMY